MNQVEDWVTIAVFSCLPEADVLKSLLESGGIETFIPEKYTTIMTGIQIRVQVRSSSAEEARKLLEEFQPASQKAKCPSCGSRDVRIKPTDIRGWFQFIVKGTGRKICGSCGQEIPS